MPTIDELKECALCEKEIWADYENDIKVYFDPWFGYLKICTPTFEEKTKSFEKAADIINKYLEPLKENKDIGE